MNAAGTSADGSGETRQRQRLQNRKRLAAALLVLAGAVFIATLILHRHAGFGVLGLVQAMAEAALIGGLADWYAVVALFRHPLGLPLPHTAIIPRKKDAIGRNLADFICAHFLGSEQIVERIRAMDPARKLAAHLRAPESARKLADVAAALASNFAGLLDNHALQEFVSQSVREKLASLDLANRFASFLDILTRDGRHREAVDSLLEDVAGYVDQPDVRGMLADRIAEELWSIVRWVKLDKVVADNLAQKVSDAIRELIHDMARDPNHPLRQRFDRQIPQFIDRLRTDEALREKVHAFRDRLIANGDLADYIRHLCRMTLARVRRDLANPDSSIRLRMANASMALGRELDRHTELRTWFNDWLVATATPLADRYRETARAYIVRRVEAWSADELTEQLELGIGRDLQWIRYNGTAVGALIGALLYGLGWAVHLLAP